MGVLYIEPLSIFVNVWKVKENLASFMCVYDAKSAFRRQGPALTYISQGYARTSAASNDAAQHVKKLER